MRFHAKVNCITGNTRHYMGTLIDGRPHPVNKLPDPEWVEISGENNAFYLLRFDSKGNCVADTWHQTLEDAMRQAAFEFNIASNEWTAIEDGAEGGEERGGSGVTEE